MNNITIPIGMAVSGELRIKRYEPDGSMSLDTGWMSNMVVDLGLDGMPNTPNWGSNWCLGSGATAVSPSDTALSSFLKRITASTGTSRSQVAGTSPDYIYTDTDSRRWDAGAGESGTVREFGIGLNSTGTSLGTRLLVSPAVTKSDEQVLDFFYRMTWRPLNTADKTGQVTINSELFDYTARWMGLGDSSISIINAGFDEYASTAAHRAYSGNIGATVEDVPTGTVSSCESYAGYKQSDGVRRWDVVYGVDDANFGVRSAMTRIQAVGNQEMGYQVEFSRVSDSAAIPKTDQQKLTITWEITMTRYP